MEAADNQQHTDKLRCINYVVYACLAYKNVFKFRKYNQKSMRSQHFWAWQKELSTFQNLTIHHMTCPTSETMSLTSASALLSLLCTLVKYQTICSSNFTGFSGISSSREFGQAMFGTSSRTSALQDNHRSFLKLCLRNAHSRESQSLTQEATPAQLSHSSVRKDTYPVSCLPVL